MKFTENSKGISIEFKEMKKRRNKKNCKYFDGSSSSIGYCTHPLNTFLFCDCVCSNYEPSKNKKEVRK